MNMAITTHGKHEAAAETHQGKIIGITDSKLVIKLGKCEEQSFTVVHDVRVTRDGKLCSVYDLRLGVAVRITTRQDDEHAAIAIEWILRD
jgi:hypothetical protein